MSKKWPLHPQPGTYQVLRPWVEKLAEAYEVSYKGFCKNALKLTPEEASLLNTLIPESAFVILSNGTGLSIEDLRERNPSMMLRKLIRELDKAFAENPDWYPFKGPLKV